ncbi:MAG: GtrA family protein [Polyangiaceae bacterium]|jgi:putative flippase GtrA|nr:GtrA family protein [Polyangiaceae bacterium]MBK8943070.1 GtrA family protein [Polyangiaceae bacterium]
MPPSRRLSLQTVLKSSSVGALATFIDFAVLAALVSGASLDPRLASPFALTAGLSVQFVGNKVFAFGDRRQAWGRQAAAFLGVEALAFCANLALFDVAVQALPLPYLLVRALCQSLVYFGLCLPLWSRVFQQGGAKEVAQ